MNAKTIVLEKAVELSSKVGHFSRQSFKLLLEDKANRTERLRWSELRDSGFFSESKFIDDFEYLTLSNQGTTFARSIGFSPSEASGRTQVLHDEVAAMFAQWLEGQKLIKSWTPEIQLKKSSDNVLVDSWKLDLRNPLRSHAAPNPALRFVVLVVFENLIIHANLLPTHC